FAEMRRFPDELIKLLKYLALIVNQEFREAHHVQEQDMGDFEMNFLFNLGRHPVKLPENKAIDNSASRRPSRAKLTLSNTFCSASCTSLPKNSLHSIYIRGSE